jgi:SAM-dependent methyltransferase
MDQHFKRDCVPVVADELEQLILREIALRVRNCNPPRVLDIHGEDGRRAMVMASLGAQVLVADVEKFKEPICRQAQAEGLAEAVKFVVYPDPKLFSGKESFDLVFCHHGIHRLPYDKAKRALQQIIKTLNIGGKIYISAYGLHSTLGEGYADADAPVEKRFCPLSAIIARNYNLEGPVCLYTERNLVNLLFESGGSVLRSFTTTHGTIKAVAVRM